MATSGPPSSKRCRSAPASCGPPPTVHLADAELASRRRFGPLPYLRVLRGPLQTEGWWRHRWSGISGGRIARRRGGIQRRRKW
jgi:hypothetical protein